MSSIASRRLPRLRAPVAWVLGATIAMGAVTAIAVEDQAGSLPTQAECNAFKAATEASMKNQLMIVNTFMGSATNTMQSAVSKGNSCIGNLAFLDFDLSRLIPDFGILGGLLSGVLNKIVAGVINRACAALTDVMNKPSEIWNSIVGGMNVNDQFQSWAGGISYNLPGGSGRPGGGNWGGAQPGATTDPWAGASQSGGSTDGTCTYGPSGLSCTVAGIGEAPNVPSGTNIGANYQYLVIECTRAAEAEANGGAPGSAAAACKAAQDYLNAWAPYLRPGDVPQVPSYPFTTPGNIGQNLGGNTGGGGDFTIGGGKSSRTTSAPAGYNLPVRK